MKYPIIFLILFLSQFVIFYINNIEFKKKTIISIVIPFTSKGLSKTCKELKIYDLLLIQLFYPSFIQTINPDIYVYKLYLGISFDDCIYKRHELLNDLILFFKNKSFLV